jgi:hypothetical protein
LAPAATPLFHADKGAAVDRLLSGKVRQSSAALVSYGGCLSLQPKYHALSNAYAPPSGAAFVFPKPVEALWKQEGAKSLEKQRKL